MDEQAIGTRAGITLEQYAEIRAHLRHREAEGESRVLSRLGVERGHWDAASTAWTKALDEDAEGSGDLLVQFAATFSDARRRLKDGAPTMLASPLAAQAPAPISAPMAPIAPPPIASAPRMDMGTMDVGELFRSGGVLPFAPAESAPIAPPPIAPPPARDTLDEPGETVALRLDRSLLPAIPFKSGAASPPGPAAAPPPGPAPVDEPGETVAFRLDRSLLPATPFTSGAAQLPIAQAAPMPKVNRAPVGFTAPAAPPQFPTLTVEQYASLTAELAVSPERAAEIRARYQIGADDAFQGLSRSFTARFSADPDLYARFGALSAQYRAWLSQKKNG